MLQSREGGSQKKITQNKYKIATVIKSMKDRRKVTLDPEQEAWLYQGNEKNELKSEGCKAINWIKTVRKCLPNRKQHVAGRSMERRKLSEKASRSRESKRKHGVIWS